MTSIHATMLVMLGFLMAALLAFVVMPAFWARAVRLTQARLRQAMPLTESEIKADRDRLKADFAIQIHKLSTSLDEGKLNAARQLIELNRRDAAISTLERDLDANRADLEEHRNARRVLEQTIADRIPKVEQRLAEAKKLLFERDREIASHSAEAQRALHALDQAGQINVQQQTEISRLRQALTHRGASNRDSLKDARFDAETALRSEIEALRGQTRDQAALIEKLTAAPARDGGVLVASTPDADSPVLIPTTVAPQPEKRLNTATQDATAVVVPPTDVPLRPEVSAAASSSIRGADPLILSLESKVRALTAESQDKAAEIAKLKAGLATFEGGEAGQGASLKESKLAMKAKLNALQVEVGSQLETIKRLRAEVASANERIARQASHFMEEMKRLGAGTLPASGGLKSQPAAAEPERRRTLADRLIEAQPQLATERLLNSPGTALGTDGGLGSNEAYSDIRDGAGLRSMKPARRLSVLRPAVSDTKPAEVASAVSSQAQPTTEPHAPLSAAANGSSPVRVEEPKPKLAERLADLAKT